MSWGKDLIDRNQGCGSRQINMFEISNNEIPNANIDPNIIDTAIVAALMGSRGEQQKLIAQEGLRWVQTLLAKNHDYGGTVFSVPKLAPEASADTCIRVRMNDKVDRIITLLSKGEESRQVKSESLEDSFRDLGAYCLLWIVNKKINKPKT